MVDAAHEKEKKAKDTIQTLQQEIDHLTALVEQGAVLSSAEGQRWVCGVKTQVTVSRHLKILIYVHKPFFSLNINQLTAACSEMDWNSRYVS